MQAFNSITRSFLLIAFVFISQNYAVTNPQLPMGMNIGGASYWSPAPYNDPFKTAGEFFSYSGSEWSNSSTDKIPLDSNGYPLELPLTVDSKIQFMRSMINTCRGGDYLFLKDGQGDIAFKGSASAKTLNNQTIVTIDGSCSHGWIQITRSVSGDHLRNFKLVPIEYSSDLNTVPLFDKDFLKGLESFHALRYMDWMSTNNSTQQTWSDRAKPNYYSYGQGKGMPIEDAITLSNLLNADPWFCVPAQADDDYIKKFAELVKEKLKPGLKVYLEFSNEIWNWGFKQSSYIGRNATDVTWEGDTLSMGADTLRANLAQVGIDFCKDAANYCHPEKDAYMMDRTFKIWRSVFDGESASRLIRVATGQHAWYDNTRRILSYLFDKGDGADAISVGGYFNFSKKDHEAWNAMDPTLVTTDMIIDSVFNGYESSSGLWTRESAKYARQYNIDYMVYEGGQHMQPYLQGDYAYNPSVWEAQIDPRMYDLYMKNFETHVEDTVDCKLFMAFSYASERESKYGSWGHLENFAQANLSSAELKIQAPKFAALLDANTPKNDIITPQIKTPELEIKNSTRYVLKNNRLQIEVNKDGVTRYFDLKGSSSRHLD